MQNALAAGGDWVPFPPKPAAKRYVHLLRHQQRHGGRVRGIADARRLWSRLEEGELGGPSTPAEGFPADVIQYASYGREYVRMALEQSTTIAWKWWRSIRRAHIRRGGGGEAYLFGENDVAGRQYRERHLGKGDRR